MENLPKHFADKINMQGLTANFLSGKTCKLWSGASFGPRGHNLNKQFGRDHKTYATYIISMTSGFRQDF